MKSNDTQTNKVPVLRFREFTEPWQSTTIGDLFSQGQDRYEEGQELLSVTMSDGVKKRSGIKGKDNSSDDKSNYKRVYKGDIVYNSMRMWQGASGVSKYDGVVSPAYTVLKNNSEHNSEFFGYYFKLPKVVYTFERYSQGMTSDTWNLKYPQIAKINIYAPTKKEQEKISSLMLCLDNKISILKKKIEKYSNFKKGILQSLFSQSIRFRDENSNNYADWEPLSLSEILHQRSERNGSSKDSEVFSVAKKAGVINQIEHLGRSYAGMDTSNYKVVWPWDVVYTKSPTSEFPYGIIKQNKLNRKGIVSVLYGVYEPNNQYIGNILDSYFSSWVNTYNYLNPIVQKGAKNTINISDSSFLKGSKVLLPNDSEEQQKISEFLNDLDRKIKIQDQKLVCANRLKGSLQSKMYI